MGFCLQLCNSCTGENTPFEQCSYIDYSISLHGDVGKHDPKPTGHLKCNPLAQHCILDARHAILNDMVVQMLLTSSAFQVCLTAPVSMTTRQHLPKCLGEEAVLNFRKYNTQLNGSCTNLHYREWKKFTFWEKWYRSL